MAAISLCMSSCCLAISSRIFRCWYSIASDDACCSNTDFWCNNCCCNCMVCCCKAWSILNSSCLRCCSNCALYIANCCSACILRASFLALTCASAAFFDCSSSASKLLSYIFFCFSMDSGSGISALGLRGPVIAGMAPICCGIGGCAVVTTHWPGAAAPATAVGMVGGAATYDGWPTTYCVGAGAVPGATPTAAAGTCMTGRAQDPPGSPPGDRAMPLASAAGAAPIDADIACDTHAATAEPALGTFPLQEGEGVRGRPTG
mmetsp:Transcript_113234/g.283548  ORF Transcript_113234/g.283548 Transcript_113234/m.283548 type:complete len:261 (+) Transcript_113234:795-1577(+)